MVNTFLTRSANRRVKAARVKRYARTTQLGVYNLLPYELFWQERQPHLET